MKSRAKLVAFEGLECSGKSTVVRVLGRRLQKIGLSVTVCGELESPLREFIRRQLAADASAFLKAYSFALDRAWTYEKTLLPALEAQRHVLWDRYVDSAFAYRAAELRVKKDTLATLELVQLLNSPFRPADLTIYLDVDVETAVGRAEMKKHALPYGRGMMERVLEEYGRLAQEGRYRLVDARRKPGEVIESVEALVLNELQGEQK